jgi:uncharacterized protein YecE (DUF72 family)
MNALGTSTKPFNIDAVRTGVCGFCRPQAELFHRFKLLEVQQTFYWPPRRKTVERWRTTAPDDFEFTLKAVQTITHAGDSPTYRKARLSADQRAQCGGFCDTPLVREGWQLTRELAAALKASFVVFQSPPRFEATDANVAHFRQFFHWASRDYLRFAWEPRHKSWTSDLIRDLCQELDLVHTVDPLEQQTVWGSPKYYRLHGTLLGNFRYEYGHPYTDAELREIHRRCLPGPTYCLFNNKQMADDATRFRQLLLTPFDAADLSTEMRLTR